MYTVLLRLFVLVLPNELLARLQLAGIYATAGLTVASGLQYASRIAESLHGVDQATVPSRPRPDEDSPLAPPDEETVVGRNRAH